MDEITIDTTVGTMTALPWHVGKHIALDPSGFNWRVQDGDVDRLIAVLENGGTAVFTEYRQEVIVESNSYPVYITAKDTASPDYVTHTHLTANGKAQLLEALKSVASR